MHIYFENKFILDFGKSKLYVYVQKPSCGLHLGATSLMSKSGCNQYFEINRWKLFLA